MPIRYTIRQGDCTSSLGFRYGFFPDTIWEDADNEALRGERDDMDVLLPGDVLTIPDKRLKQVDAAVDKVHKFKRRGVPKKFRLRVMFGDTPITSAPYELDIDGTVHSGSTDADGWLEVGISPAARTAMLSIEGQEFEIALGHFDPINTESGVEGRLRSLGFYDGKGELRAAIEAFQTSEELDVTGEADGPTKDALVERCGV